MSTIIKTEIRRRMLSIGQRAYDTSESSSDEDAGEVWYTSHLGCLKNEESAFEFIVEFRALLDKYFQ